MVHTSLNLSRHYLANGVGSQSLYAPISCCNTQTTRLSRQRLRHNQPHQRLSYWQPPVSLSPWLSVWVNKSSVRGGVKRKEQCSMENSAKGLTELTHWGRDKMAASSQTTLSNTFSWMKILKLRWKFRWSLFLRVQLTIFQHWFR